VQQPSTSRQQTAGLARPSEETHRVPLDDGAATTLHVLRLKRREYTARVVVLDPVRRLVEYCADRNVELAMIGGFYIRAESIPLGDLRIEGRVVPSRPFDEPWNRVRACLHSEDGEVTLRGRDELAPQPRGDLLQAGPMLVRDGVCLVEKGTDREGFSSGQSQFDSDITEGRYPRAALGVSGEELIAVVCDGRAEDEAGLNMAELGRAMAELGAIDAINLDGGGSASMVIGGRLVNTPREDHGIELVGGRAISTVIRFERR
jgi:exopolysaccharide biosynthesis protein